ncbi:hypothetical protein MCA1405 [Methylococcus capsulatus str. Bath]|uniref:Uncharacterized protein n=1 Tax=Methylococcus capsulatus (strain ATCC 33009 / NCIMB 11132 / Bath) TaxID=243233 RepID=Q608T4_METCA|nr:hypothetical protein MCA1405 [Methylococcus capsulatus str. Bath]
MCYRIEILLLNIRRGTDGNGTSLDMENRRQPGSSPQEGRQSCHSGRTFFNHEALLTRTSPKSIMCAFTPGALVGVSIPTVA